MKYLIALCLLLVVIRTEASAPSAATFSEFYVGASDTGANNLNSGSTTNSPLTYAGGTFVRSTGVFTVASGNPITDPVPLNSWASIYTTSGATVATFIAKVIGTNATTITVSLTAIGGATSSVSESANASTCIVGGPWTGPATTVGFPFTFIVGTMTNASSTAVGYAPRVNIRAATYSITAKITQTLAGPMRIQGYSVNPDDGVMATIDGGATGTSFILLDSSGASVEVYDMIFANNGNSGGTGTYLCNLTANTDLARRVVVHDARLGGLYVPVAIECEAYAINKAASAGSGINVTVLADRCYSHDNTSTASIGFSGQSAAAFFNCVANNNKSDGFTTVSVRQLIMVGCEAYNNGGNGVTNPYNAGGSFIIENSNFLKNTGYGIESTGAAALRQGCIVNCGFGVGTMANGTADIHTASMASVDVINPIQYASGVTPWIDPANGDFRINNSASINKGRGNFTVTSGSAPNTISYPNIGATQNTNSPSGGSYIFVQ